MEYLKSVKNPAALAASVILCNLAGVLGGLFTDTGADSWYAIEIVKPWFLPPSIVFPIVWTILYTLMGVSLYLLWTEDKTTGNVNVALGFFVIQLILNIGWSYLFFGLKSPLYGLIGIIFLWIFILQTILTSYRVNKNAAYILIPYILWVTFAAFLNAALLALNPLIA